MDNQPKFGLMMRWYWVVPYCSVMALLAQYLSNNNFFEGLLYAGVFGGVYGVIAGTTGW